MCDGRVDRLWEMKLKIRIQECSWIDSEERSSVRVHNRTPATLAPTNREKRASKCQMAISCCFALTPHLTSARTSSSHHVSLARDDMIGFPLPLADSDSHSTTQWHGTSKITGPHAMGLPIVTIGFLDVCPLVCGAFVW